MLGRRKKFKLYEGGGDKMIMKKKYEREREVI